MRELAVRSRERGITRHLRDELVLVSSGQPSFAAFSA
jgi:hypothetical protein